MSDFRIHGEVDIHDVDFNGVAKASSVLRYMQSAAQLQLTENGMSYDQLKDIKRAFLLSKLWMEIKQPLRAYAPFTAITYPCESRGYSFLRCHALEQDGITVARAVSVWGLIDTESKALVRVEDFDLRLPIFPSPDLLPTRFRMPSELADAGGYGVHYGDVDQNGHMNNTRYPDMYSNFMNMKDKTVSSITVNYLNEASAGDKLRVLRAVEDGVYYFRTVRSDGKINSEAKILLSDI